MKLQDTIIKLNRELDIMDRNPEQIDELSEKEIIKIAKEKEALGLKFFEYSVFDIDFIGEEIAKLLSAVTTIPHIFITPYRVIYTPKIDKKRGIMYSEERKLPIKIVVQEEYAKKEYRGKHFLLDMPETIVLDYNKKEFEHNPCTKKNLYTNDFELNLNRHFGEGRLFAVPPLSQNSYTIIKGFIDSIIEYRFQNNKQEITSEEIDKLLDAYINSFENTSLKHQKVKQLTKDISN